MTSVRSSRGFSLIEIVAVIFLIALAVSAVSISFSKSMSGAKVQAATRDMIAA